MPADTNNAPQRADTKVIHTRPRGLRGMSVKKRIAYLGLSLLNHVLTKRADKVVLHSIPFLEDGTRSVIQALATRNFTLIVLVDGEPSDEPTLPVTFLPKSSMRAVWHYLTARYVFTTHSLFGASRPPRGQTVVNLWHGEPPVKVMGQYEGQRRQQASVVPVLSHVGQAYRCTEFGLHPRHVPIMGAPRNDQMLQSDSARAQKLLGIHGATYLWMPTFRAMRSGDQERIDASRRYPGVPYSSADLDILDAWLMENNVKIVIKPHPLDADSFAGRYSAISLLTDSALLTNGLSVYTCLSAFDGLITDASSIWIDYLLLNRPIIFSFPDYEEYRLARGLNLEPYKLWVPGPFVQSMQDLLDVLGRLSANHDIWSDTRERAARQFHLYHDDGATGRLLAHIGAIR